MGEPTHNETSADSIDKGYEVSDARISPLIISGIVLLLVMLLGIGLMAGMFDLLASLGSANRPQLSATAAFRAPLPGPHLQTDPSEELVEQRAEEAALLTHYEWVDRSNGVVRIPVARAMALLVDRGFPARGQKGGGR